jgi:site-specific DNA-methyltransferase (adenine-specific)
VAELDAQSGVTTSAVSKTEVGAYSGESITGFLRGRSGPSNQHGDTGGASRFFFCAKASRFERELGCEHLPEREKDATLGDGMSSATKIRTEEQAESGEVDRGSIRNHHPCVKPLKLTQYLATLALCPPRADGKPRRILIPYAGSGSEMIGAIRAGWEEVVGIERDADYIEILRARIARWIAVPAHMLVDEVLAAAEKKKDARQTDLFGGGR